MCRKIKIHESRFDVGSVGHDIDASIITDNVDTWCKVWYDVSHPVADRVSNITRHSIATHLNEFKNGGL